MNSICKTKKYGNFWVIPNTERSQLSHCDLGILHREDGPAIEFDNGFKAWYINGLRHRKDGPAMEFINGDKHWYFNGGLHREDGPAEETNNGAVFWYLNDVEIKPTIEMMSKYIRLNPDNILKYWEYPLEIQILAISLKPGIIFDIPHPDSKLKELYPQLFALKDSGLI